MANTEHPLATSVAEQFRNLAERTEVTALHWRATGGPKPLPGWTSHGVWAARKQYLWTKVAVPAGHLLWIAFDHNSFKSMPRIRRFVGNWRTNIRAEHPGWRVSVLQGKCFDHFVYFYRRKIMRDPRHLASEIDEALAHAIVANQLAKIIESEING